jgi:carbonic anhydrase
VAGSKLIVVLGHTACGAIKGACDHVEMGNLTELLSKIQPAVYEETATTDASERTSKNKAFVENVADINVKHSVKSIVSRSTILAQMIEKGEIAIVGGKHHLDTGKVVFYDDTLIATKKEVKAQIG